MDKLTKHLRESWYKLELEEKLVKAVWYHGDTSKREGFCDQRMDRELFVKDANANGPGIYLTNNYEEALGYAEGKGWVYTLEVDLSKGRIIRESDTVVKNKEFLYSLIKLSQKRDSERVWYALTDYGLEIQSPEKVKDLDIKKVINNWLSFSLIDGCIMVYKEFFGRNANEWVNSMKSLGMVGFLVKQRESDHLIVYNCEAIKIIKEDKV